MNKKINKKDIILLIVAIIIITTIVVSIIYQNNKNKKQEEQQEIEQDSLSLIDMKNTENAKIENGVKENTSENREYVEKLLKKYGLYEFKEKYPAQLSGGMRQRVALIRTLAIRPKILLLDEAFSALDYQTRLMVTEDIFKILKAENITALMVTHDISEAISMSDRVIVLSERPATVKTIHKIDFEMENRTPLNCRENPKFSKYFNLMWKELGEKNIT